MRWTHDETKALQQLLGLKLSGYTTGRVDKLTLAAFCARLEDFSPTVALQAVELLDLYARNRGPMVGDVYNLAASIEQHGHAAARLAARTWPDSLEYEPPAPTAKQWVNAVKLAKRRTGNPSPHLRTVAELPQDAATPTESVQAFDARVEALMQAENLSRDAARWKLVEVAMSGFGASMPESPRRKGGEKAS